MIMKLCLYIIIFKYVIYIFKLNQQTNKQVSDTAIDSCLQS